MGEGARHDQKRSFFTVVVVGDELYAVSGDEFGENSSIEKLSKLSGAWEMVSTLKEDRRSCSVAVVGSKIYVFGSYRAEHDSTWNAFDVIT